MSKKDREGMSKRQEFREKRRREQQRNRMISIGAIVIGALLIAALFLIQPIRQSIDAQNALKTPVAPVETPVARERPNVNRNSTGDPNAPVQLTEFADYQCPFCKDFWTATESQIIDTYVKTGKVLYTYRSAGNWVSNNVNSATGTNDTESRDAAEASYCAADQNKFWQMHDALYTNAIGEADGTSFNVRRIPLIAQSVGLDMTTFNACMSSQKYLNQVNQDGTDAQAAGIQGTPWFIITYTVNGQKQTLTVDGNQPFSTFQQKLDQALAAAGAK
jgi:protein-disulfide isomerase